MQFELYIFFEIFKSSKIRYKTDFQDQNKWKEKYKYCYASLCYSTKLNLKKKYDLFILMTNTRVHTFIRIHRANRCWLPDRIHISFDADIGYRVQKFRISRWITKNLGRRPSLRF